MANQYPIITTASATPTYSTFSFGGWKPTQARSRPPRIASTATGFENAPRLNGPLCCQVLPSCHSPAAIGMAYERYKNTAQPAASTPNAGAYSVPMIVSAAPTQIATTGVRYTALTVLSAFDAGRPPSRAKA